MKVFRGHLSGSGSSANVGTDNETRIPNLLSNMVGFFKTLFQCVYPEPVFKLTEEHLQTISWLGWFACKLHQERSLQRTRLLPTRPRMFGEHGRLS